MEQGVQNALSACSLEQNKPDRISSMLWRNGGSSMDRTRYPVSRIIKKAALSSVVTVVIPLWNM